MPSSISNSDFRAEKYLKNNNWFLVWVAVAVVLFLVLGSWEIVWRYRGFTPQITDDWPVWSAIRRQANNNERAIALVGASRILLGLDPAILGQTMNRPVHMLAIDGSDPLPILAHLADDPDFSGDVICSFPPYWLGGNGSSSGDRAEKWVRKYSSQPLSSKVETRLSLLIQANLAFRYSGLSPAKLWEKWWEDEAIRPPYAPMRPDRYRPADYSLTDLASLREARVQRTRELHENVDMFNHEEFRKRIAIIQKAVDSIRSRGGEVFFVRFPSCGEVKAIEETYVPRRRYWDIFARELSAFTIHSDDYPKLQNFTCMDGSHLGYDDANYFTRELAAILQRLSG